MISPVPIAVVHEIEIAGLATDFFKGFRPPGVSVAVYNSDDLVSATCFIPTFPFSDRNTV